MGDESKDDPWEKYLNEQSKDERQEGKVPSVGYICREHQTYFLLYEIPQTITQSIT